MQNIWHTPDRSIFILELLDLTPLIRKNKEYLPDDSIALSRALASRPEPSHVQSSLVHLHLLMWTCP